MHARKMDIRGLIRERIADLEVELAKHRRALAELDGHSAVQPPPPPAGFGRPKRAVTKKERVLAVMGSRWVTISGLAEEVGLTRDEVRNVIHDTSVKSTLDRREKKGTAQEIEYRRRDSTNE